MDAIASTLLTNGPLGMVCLVLLYVARQLWADGKSKDQALLNEKDKRISDATAFANALAAGLATMGEQNERFEAALNRRPGR